MVQDELLPQAVLRQIGDKLYEKRKLAALEVEQIVKRLAQQGDQGRIRQIVDKLISEYAFSPQANHRKGALLCLAAATVGLGEPTEQHLRQIVPPVLASFTDQDSRVRYYACEALYNIAKVAREGFIMFFNEVFDAMFRLCADSEANVQNAVQFLDNLIKDIVTASPSFSIDAFVPKLRDYLRVVHPNKRQFLISWITVLDSVPDLDMLAYLPQLLDGLMNMLSDPNREIRVAAHKAMMEFLIEIHATRTIDFNSLVRVLVEKASSQDEFTRLTAIKWLKEFVEMASGQLLEQYPQILGAVLSNISHSSKEITQVAHEANSALLSLQPPVEPAGGQQHMDTGAILTTISIELRSEQEPSRLEALRWIHFLLNREQSQVLQQLPTLLPALLDALSAASEHVVLQSLSVLAAIASCPQQFKPVLVSLLGRFRGESGALLLQRGGALVIRRLCGHMGAEKVFKELSSILDEEEDLAFASTLVQALNLILLTSPEVRELREMLRQAQSDPQGAALFSALYRCWSHSTGALLSLCFLAQAYDHACDIIQSFSNLPIGAEVLVQIDRLVQLLETPCFTFLRLQLLQPRQYPRLLQAMYGLLMLLPQSNSFRTLSARLQSLPTLALMQLDMGVDSAAAGRGSGSTSSSGGAAGAAPAAAGGTGRSTAAAPTSDWADFAALLQVFCSQQQKHFAAEERGAVEGAAAGAAPMAEASPSHQAQAGSSSGAGAAGVAARSRRGSRGYSNAGTPGVAYIHSGGRATGTSDAFAKASGSHAEHAHRRYTGSGFPQRQSSDGDHDIDHHNPHVADLEQRPS